MDIVSLLPLVMDIKKEIKRYLIPPPPFYGLGIVKRCHMISTSDGVLYSSSTFNSVPYDMFHERISISINYLHSCGHDIIIYRMISGTFKIETPCFWCRS